MPLLGDRQPNAAENQKLDATKYSYWLQNHGKGSCKARSDPTDLSRCQERRPTGVRPSNKWNCTQFRRASCVTCFLTEDGSFCEAPPKSIHHISLSLCECQWKNGRGCKALEPDSYCCKKVLVARYSPGLGRHCSVCRKRQCEGAEPWSNGKLYWPCDCRVRNSQKPKGQGGCKVGPKRCSPG